MTQLARRVGCLTVVLGLALTACAPSPADYPTPTPIPTPSQSNKPVYTVTRGTIDAVVKGLGRVAAQEESVLYFRQDGRLFHLDVETDQKVKKGDLLAELDTGDLANQVQAARIQTDIAQLQLDQALAQQSSGSQTAAVTAAQSGVARAEAAYQQAQDNLTSLLTGSTPDQLAAAKAGVTAAQTQLAQDQAALTKLQTPPDPNQIAVARANVDKAQAALAQAQAAYDKVRYQPNLSARPESAALQQATTAYNAAKAAFDLATAPPKPEDVANAKQAIVADQAALSAAQKKLAVLQQGPKSSDIDAARQAVASAQADLDAARAGLEKARGASAGEDLGVQIAQKQAELAKDQLQTLQDQLDQAQLRAPYDGVITETDDQDGDKITAYAPVITISNPAKLEIAVALAASDLTQVQVGQSATIQLNAYPTTNLASKVIRMPAVAVGDSQNVPATLQTVRLTLPTPPGPVNIGDLANVSIDVQKKDGVLILPTTAIRTFGGKNFVVVASPNGQQTEVDITIGISDDTNTEITKGLAAGDKVVAP